MSTPQPTSIRAALAKLAIRVFVAVYLLLVVISNAWTVERAPHPGLRACEQLTKVVTYTDSRGRSQEAKIAAWGFGNWSAPADVRPPVVLLHGCPGAASDFLRLAPAIAHDGRRVIVVDLPGFGVSERRVADYSMESFASAVLALLDELRVREVHAVGWSNSGGVVLHMAATAPDRVRSMTLLAAVGDQRFEGSGSYAVEHVKYALGGIVAEYGPLLVPHFGALGDRDWRVACMRYFADSDQRPLAGMMEQAQTPALILHGRDDFLVPVRAAERHHELLRVSRLHILDASHFIPFTHVVPAATAVSQFVGEVEATGTVVRDRVDPAPRPAAAGPARLVEPVREAVRGWSWWTQAALIGLIAAASPALALVVSGGLVMGIDVDWFVAAIGLLCGRVAVECARGWRAGRGGRRGYWQAALSRGAAGAGFDAAGRAGTFARDAVWAWTSGAGWRERWMFVAGAAVARGLRGGMYFVGGMIVAGATLPSRTHEATWLGTSMAVLAIVAWSCVGPAVMTGAGRRDLRARLGRAMHHEYWPAWAFYGPVAGWIVLLGLRYRSLTLPTLCNPGVSNGGGIAGERKSEIMNAMGAAPELLRTVAIPAGESGVRLGAIRASGLQYPMVLKPDQGERGHAFKLVRTESDAAAYFEEMRGDAVAQPYHAGPCECGVFWMRVVGPGGELTDDGRIFSVTRKQFPSVVGDGVRTIETLIDADARYRKQRDVFVGRMGERCFEVPVAGERVVIAVSGNHCQGTLFADGGSLGSEALRAKLTGFALGFKGGFDFGRFDIRYESDDALRDGEGFAVVELNGLTSESTNCYDPARSVFWAWGVLMRQWLRAFELGEARRRLGGRPLSLLDIRRMVRAHAKSRTGSAIAD